MTSRLVAVTAVIVGGWLTACSRPAIELDQASNQIRSAEARDIHLVEQPAVAEPRTSDLEAGRPEAPAARVVERQPAAPPMPVRLAAETTAEPSVVGEVVAPELTLAVAPAPSEVAEPAPAIIRSPPATTWLGGGNGPGIEGGAPSSGRGPGIIIRGGRGGLDDDCDLHRPGFRGIAINRRGAGPSGGVMVNNRAPGGRSFGGSRVGRRGIR